MSDFEICFQPVPVSDYCGPYATPESLHQLAGNLIWMIIFDKEQERTKFNDNIFLCLLLLNAMCSCDNPSWWEKNSAAPVADAAESLRTQLDRHLRSWSQLVWWLMVMVMVMVMVTTVTCQGHAPLCASSPRMIRASSPWWLPPDVLSVCCNFSPSAYLEIDLSLLTLDDESWQKRNSAHSLERHIK